MIQRGKHTAVIATLVLSVAAHVFLILSAPSQSSAPSTTIACEAPAPPAPCECESSQKTKKAEIRYHSATAKPPAELVARPSEHADPMEPSAIGNCTWYREARAFAAIANSGGTDKANMHQYHPLYAKALAPFREAAAAASAGDRPRFKMLEIGLGCTMGGKWGPAGGYHVFRQFLPNTKYHSFEYDFNLCLKRWRKMGADQNPELHDAVEYLKANVVVGDQGNVRDLDRAIERFGAMDIIVDDGSHKMNHQRATFRHLFLHGLRPGGVYIIEDLNANFVWKYRDLFGVTKEAQRARKTMVHYIHDLLTAMAFPYWDAKNYVFDSAFELDEEVVVWVEDIVCVREACAITKKLKPFDRFQSQLVL